MPLSQEWLKLSMAGISAIRDLSFGNASVKFALRSSQFTECGARLAVEQIESVPLRIQNQ
jgi:hypothetical protein